MAQQRIEKCRSVKLSDGVGLGEMLKRAFEQEDDVGGLEDPSCVSDILEQPAKRQKFNDRGGTKPVGKWGHKHQKRKFKREQKILANGYAPLKTSVEKSSMESVSSLSTGVSFADFRPKRGGYVAQNTPRAINPAALDAVEDLVSKHEFKYLKWDGRTDYPLEDHNQLIHAVLAGQPRDTTYAADLSGSFQLMQRLSASEVFTTKELNHIRGSFPAVNIGFTLPNGFQKPINLNDQHHEAMVQELRQDKGLTRAALYQSASLALWAPDVYGYYKKRVDQVCEHDPSLKKNFPKSVFPTAAFNFGNVRTHKHRDTQNCPFGWCAITALGQFDPTKGGHLVLWELKLIVEFPPNATILIPSAMITHSNTPVAEGEVRNSFTQYCAGGIFRYVDNGFMTDKLLRQKDPIKFQEIEAMKDTRWKMGLGLLSTLDELRNRYRT